MAVEVDVSLTTISARIGRLAPVVASLLAQNPAPARVLIHLSREGYLLDEGIAALPEDLAALVDGQRVLVEWVPNTGPYRKILPWLGRHLGTDRWVVTADDDTIYPQGWLARLVAGRLATGAVTGWTAHPIVIRWGAWRVMRAGSGHRCQRVRRCMCCPSERMAFCIQGRIFRPR